jgi:hypothetical protein
MSLTALRTFLLLSTLAATVTLPIPSAQCSQTADTSETAAIVTTPSELSNGSPCLLTIHLRSAAITVTAKWQSHPVLFFASADRSTWYAIAGVDVAATPGNYPITIEAHLQDGTHQTLHRDIAVTAAPYAKVTLTVPDKFVQPDAESQKIIAADQLIKDKAFASSAPKPEWTGDFLPPLKQAPRSDSFGTQRIFNGTLASVHRGLDYRAAPGTPVAAINSGRVILAQPLFFEGGCVVIDHGLGLMSVYMHLSKIDVTVGETVSRGHIIARSGATGRATGPHLHLGVRWQGSYLDPAKLFELSLPQSR